MGAAAAYATGNDMRGLGLTILGLFLSLVVLTGAQAQDFSTNAKFAALMLHIGRDLVGTAEGSGSIRHWVGTALDARLAALRRRGRRFKRLDAAGRHRVRIAAKKLRYVADAFAPLHGATAEAYLDRLAAVQDELGRANDLRMAQQMLPGLGLDAALAGRLHGALACAMDAQESQAGGRASAWRALREMRPFWRKPGKSV